MWQEKSKLHTRVTIGDILAEILQARREWSRNIKITNGTSHW